MLGSEQQRNRGENWFRVFFKGQGRVKIAFCLTNVVVRACQLLFLAWLVADAVVVSTK